jgi:hypothetical protein
MSSDFDPEQALQELDRVARGLPAGSDGALAVEVAAKALLFIHATRQSAAFRDYVASMNEPLTPEQERFLREIGELPEES